MKAKEAAFRHAAKLFPESFLNIIERKGKARWFRSWCTNMPSTAHRERFAREIVGLCVEVILVVLHSVIIHIIDTFVQDVIRT